MSQIGVACRPSDLFQRVSTVKISAKSVCLVQSIILSHVTFSRYGIVEKLLSVH